MATFVRVNPGDPIQAHQLDQVIDALIGTAALGVPIALTALNDATNYALTVQNDEAGNSRALNVLKSDGTLLIRADASGVALGAPLSLAAGSVNGSALVDNTVTSAKILDGTIATADLANAAVTNAKLGSDTARANWLTNGGFEIWQRGGGPFTTAVYTADRWLLEIAGGAALSVSPDGAAANVDVGSQFAATVNHTLGASNSNVTQIVEAIPGSLRGRAITLSVRVRTNVATAIRLNMTTDGTSPPSVFSAYHSGGGAYETLSATATVPSDAGKVYCRVTFNASLAAAKIDNAMLVVGAQAADYAPLHPADDLARCLRYYELLGTTGTGDLIVLGIATAAAQSAELTLLYRAIKPVTPTVTLQGTWTTSNAAAPTVSLFSANGLRLKTTSVAAGQFYALAGVGGNISVEANP
jgi:hypothetical protein